MSLASKIIVFLSTGIYLAHLSPSVSFWHYLPHWITLITSIGLLLIPRSLKSICINLLLISIGSQLYFCQQKFENHIEKSTARLIQREQISVSARILKVKDDAITFEAYILDGQNRFFEFPKKKIWLKIKNSPISWQAKNSIFITLPSNEFKHFDSQGIHDEFKRYLQNKGYFYFGTLDAKQIMEWQKDPHWRARLRAFVIQKIDDFIPSEGSKGIVRALVLSDKSKLSTDILKTYKETGSLHTLALSGLHIGILFLLLKGFLQKGIFLQNSITKIVLFICVWSFCMLQYFPSSLLRATIMISIYLCKNQRLCSSKDIVWSSLLFILCLDPMSLFSLSYQLSYAAVLSIIYLFPKLKIPKTSSLGLQYFINLIKISVIAQIGTTPLILFHFGSLSSYSLLSSLILIPLLPTILILCFILLLCPNFEIATFIGKGISKIIDLENQYLEYITKIPFAYFDQITIREEMVFFSYFILVLASGHIKIENAYALAGIGIVLFI